MSIAFRLQNMKSELSAFEKAIDIAQSVHESENYTDYSFADGSTARIEITDDHEIYIYEV